MQQTLLVWQDHKFRFNASDMPEPPHVHIMKDGKAAKASELGDRVSARLQ